MIKKLYFAVLKWWRSQIIKNKQISVVSNNCWGGFMYQSCKLEYQFPFIGLFILPPCYIELLERFDEVMKKPLVLGCRADSLYKDYLQEDWIIGKFKGTDIEIVFMHYHSPEEVLDKWNRRLKRLNQSNMLVKFSDTDKELFNEDLLRRFEALPFPHKVCFTAKPYPQYPSVVYLPEFKDQGHVLFEWAYSYRHYNFVKEVNKFISKLK